MSHAPVREEYEFQNWTFVVQRSHIMKSAHTCEPENAGSVCHLCKYESFLSDLPQLPEMIFADNRLEINFRKSGASVIFDALKALKSVDTEHDPASKVSASREWLEARKDCPFIRNTIKKPYDWTYTPNYAGDAHNFKSIEKTNECIDLERLKLREPILFASELPLYEDELGDNGCSQLTLKFRCMPSGFFALLRYYLRIDFVSVKVVDARFYWRLDRPDYILRERQARQKTWPELTQQESQHILDANELWSTLNPVDEETVCEKMYL